MDDVDVAIIGAGPYGLSLAAHLKEAGVAHRIFGTPMVSWRNNMPPGMFLKSYGDSSSLSDPHAALTIESFCRERDVPFHPQRIPVSLADFIGYGEAFQRRFAPAVEDKRLIRLELIGGLHRLTFIDGEIVTANRIVLAVGATPFHYTPPFLSDLPRELVSHSSQYGALDRLDSREVTVLGSGSSAFDIAALAAERGATVTIIARSAAPKFQLAPNDEPPPSLLRWIVAPPALGLGAGWMLRLCAEAPQWFHAFPDRLRRSVLHGHLGPQGGYFIREKIERMVRMKLGRQLQNIEQRGGRLDLVVADDQGRREIVASDHLVAATGYRVDVNRLDFLSPSIRSALRTVEDTPVLSFDYESSIPELYFIGLASARAFGPSMRFVVGARHPAAALARRFSRPRARARSFWSFAREIRSRTSEGARSA